MNKETQKAIGKLKIILNREGAFYALLFSLFEDSHFSLSELDNYDPNQRISSDEIHWLIGFMIQNNHSFLNSYPQSINDIIEMGDEIHQVLKELQYSYVSQFSIDKENIHSERNKLAALTIAILYDGDSAYDYEYAKFSILRYECIHDWLKRNKNIEIANCVTAAKRIESILKSKGNRVYLFSPEFAHVFWGHEPSVEEKNKLRIIQFSDLYDENILSNNKRKKKAAIKSFCRNLLDMFCFSADELGPIDRYKDFLCHFSFNPITNYKDNSSFDQPGRFNILDSNPILKIQGNKYFVPFILNVFKAIYETPYFWWMEANNFSKKAGDIIGDANEAIVYNQLQKVFGKNNCWKGIILRQKNGKTISDIDILCIIGTKAICIQVKSKRLTEESKIGNIEKIKSDFRNSVFAAAIQAKKCQSYLLDTNVNFYTKDNKQTISIPTKDIKDIYTICVMCGEYNGLAHQVSYLFNTSEFESLPMVCSFFDLHLLTEYLNNPYDFTYYIKQRVETWKFFQFTNEISVLGYHLKHNLHKWDGYNVAMLDDDFARMIDKDYIPFLHGLKNKLDLKFEWQTNFLKQFCTLLHDPHYIDALFLIYDFCTDTREKFEDEVRICIDNSSNNHSMCARSFFFDDASAGLTVCAASDNFSIEDIMFYTEKLAYKYLEDINYRYSKWTIIGVSSSKPHIHFVNTLNQISSKGR